MMVNKNFGFNHFVAENEVLIDNTSTKIKNVYNYLSCFYLQAPSVNDISSIATSLLKLAL